MPSRPSTKPPAPNESVGNDRPDAPKTGQAPGIHAPEPVPFSEQELRGLCLALSEGEGFRLILATYDVPSVRDLLIDRLRADLEQRGVRLACLSASNRGTGFDLLEALQQHLAASVVPPGHGPRQAMAVVDLESCLDYRHKDRPKNNSLAPVFRGEGWGEGRQGECADYSWAVREAPAGADVLRRANLQREAFAERIPCPVVFWLMPVATGLFAQEAPDLWHWRIATFDFTGSPTEPVEASDLTRATSFEEFRGLPLGSQHEGIAALHDRLLQLEYSASGRPLAPREEAQRAALLVELGKALEAIGHREEALQATAEAVEIRRRLATQRPDAFLPDLASSLNNLGLLLSNLGRREEGLQAIAEAVEILRQLAAHHPDAFLPDLATFLNNLGLMLSNLGRREEALQVTAEAVRLTFPLVERYPLAFRDRLRGRLQNLRAGRQTLGQDPDADPLVGQAVQLLARLDTASAR